MTNPIQFDLCIGRKKPYSKNHDACPFCTPEKLTNILEKRGEMIWLMNKYPVFSDTWPTVLIETDRHKSELSEYSPGQLHEVVSFGLEKWHQMEKDRRFKSVIYFRNFGPRSGGSIRHPHSQIIGMYHYDYTDNIRDENFWGPVFHEDRSCIATLSDYPICGMAEFNVMLKPDGTTDAFADTMQTIVKFVLHDFPIPCDSYNLFFYRLKNIYVKIFPRYIASPLYLGYKITQVVNAESRHVILKKLKSQSYFDE
jgi:ATP adenylyltransferase/5',5'''-P-1,P-4-tetraphosphate phosphorylase II